jgi:hypothetical protein
MKLIYGFFLTCVLSSQLTAQVKPVKIDYAQGTRASVSVNLPYDSGFTLAMHMKNLSTVYSAILARYKNNKTLSANFKKFGFNSLQKSQQGDSILNVEFRYVDKQNSGILKPARTYKLILSYALLPGLYKPGSHSSLFGLLFDAINPDGTVDSSKLKVAERKYSDLRHAQESLLGNVSSLPADFNKFVSSYRSSIYSLDSEYRATARVVDSSTDLKGKMNFDTLQRERACVPNFYQQLLCGKGPCGERCKKKACQDSTCPLLQALKAIWVTDENEFKALVSGNLNLTDVLLPPSSLKKATNNVARLSNLKTSFDLLDEVSEAITTVELSLEEPSKCKDQFECLRKLVRDAGAAFSARIASLASLVQTDNYIMLAATNASPNYFSGIDVFDTDTYTFDFQTRTSTYITPVFGYAVFGFQKDYTDFVPYLGFQVNLQPMNRNVPFALIRNKTLLQRLCVTTAWTLRSVSSPGKRSDFFGNSSSLITAGGFKLSHVFMFNAGALWFKEINPDPYSTEKSLKASFTVSLSVNLAIRDLLNGFTNLIPSL